MITRALRNPQDRIGDHVSDRVVILRGDIRAERSDRSEEQRRPHRFWTERASCAQAIELRWLGAESLARSIDALAGVFEPVGVRRRVDSDRS